MAENQVTTAKNEPLKWWQWAVIFLFIAASLAVLLAYSDAGKGFAAWAAEDSHWAIILAAIFFIMLFIVILMWIAQNNRLAKRIAPWHVTLERSCKDFDGGLARYGLNEKMIMRMRPEIDQLEHHGAWLFNGKTGIFNEQVGAAFMLNAVFPNMDGEAKVGWVKMTRRRELSDKERAILKDPEISLQEAIHRLDEAKAIYEKEIGE